MQLQESKVHKGFYIPFFANQTCVSKEGLVIINNKITKPWIDIQNGYKKVCLMNNGKYFSISLAVLLAKVFLEENKSKEKMFVGYKDNDKDNLEINNLMWLSSKEVQDIAFYEKTKRHLIIHPLLEGDGCYPNPHECITHPGYYYVPHTQNKIIVNKNGNLFNIFLNKEHSIHLDKKGYLNFCFLNKNGKYLTTKLHRCLALMFIGKPERHKNTDYFYLQVNHIDGIKSNFCLENLEWVDGFENMKHARQTGLFTNNNPVLSRNIKTNQITRYLSISDCCRAIDLHPSELINHLRSNFSGRITKDWCVFKYDDNKSWPDVIDRQDSGNTLCYTRDIVARNLEQNKIFIFPSLLKAFQDLNLSRNSVMNHRSRKGIYSPYKGWIFTPLLTHEK